MKNLSDIVQHLITIPALVTFLAAVAAVVSGYVAFWELMNTTQKVSAIVMVIFILIAMAAWIYHRANKPLYLVPRYISSLHDRKYKLISASDKDKWDNKHLLAVLDILGVDIKSIMRKVNNSGFDLAKEITNAMQDKMAQDETFNRLGWILDKKQIGVDTVTKDDDYCQLINAKLAPLVEYFPNGKIEDAYKIACEASYQYNSFQLFTRYIDWESGNTDSPNNEAIIYGMPSKMRGKVREHISKLYGEIDEYYKSNK